MAKKLTLTEKRTRKFNTDFRFRLNVDYDEYTDCSAHGCDGICRCSRITNARVDDRDLEYLAESFIRTEDEYSVYHYGVERLMVIHKLYDSDSFDIGIRGGYYGEEIGSIKYCGSGDLFGDLHKLAAMTDDADMVKFVLEKEYGFLLDKVKKFSRASVDYVDLDDVKIPNDRYLSKVDDYEVYLDRDPKLPYAVCNFVGESVTDVEIIDGYHRYSAAKSESKKKIPIIMLY